MHPAPHTRTAANRQAAAALSSMLTLSLLLAGCNGEDAGASVAPLAPDAPLLTPSSGQQGTLLARGTYYHPFSVNRETGDWRIAIDAAPATDVAVQRFVFQPGGQSGWHTHPGPVFIQVVSGTLTMYQGDDPDCHPIVRTAGQIYIDVGGDAHLARNENPWHTAEAIVTYFAPQGAALRADAPAPGNCPF
jgi:quercetin dioxygenase-like cupin family protein